MLQLTGLEVPNMAAGARGKMPDGQNLPTSKASVESLALFLLGMIATHLKGVKQQVEKQLNSAKRAKVQKKKKWGTISKRSVNPNQETN